MGSLAWPVVLLALGLLFLVSEAFIPSGGMLGLAAAACLAASLYLAFQQSSAVGLRFLLADLVLTPTAVALGLYLWPKSFLAKKMTLHPPSADEIDVSHAGGELQLHLLAGRRGRVLTPLRPVGLIELEGRRLDALSEDGLIAVGVAIEVVAVRTGRLIVKTVTQTNDPEPRP